MKKNNHGTNIFFLQKQPRDIFFLVAVTGQILVFDKYQENTRQIFVIGA